NQRAGARDEGRGEDGLGRARQGSGPGGDRRRSARRHLGRAPDGDDLPRGRRVSREGSLRVGRHLASLGGRSQRGGMFASATSKTSKLTRCVSAGESPSKAKATR